jgi:hypothetical protein
MQIIRAGFCFAFHPHPSQVSGEPAEQPFGMLAEAIVSVKTPIRFLHP